MRGIDLLIQRSKDYRDDISSIQNGELYLCKIYILSELITSKAIETSSSSCAEITSDPFTKESNYLLKSAMDGKWHTQVLLLIIVNVPKRGLFSQKGRNQ